MFRNKVGILALAATVAFAACDDATGPEGSLSEAEATALANVLLTQALAGGAGQAAAQQVADAPVAAAIVEFDEAVTATLPCPLGGSVAVAGSTSGTTDTETGAVALDFTLTQTHSDCGVQTEEEGFDVILDGAPNITNTFSFAVDANENLEAAGGIQGAIDWSSGDRSDTCSVSLEFSGSSDAAGNSSFSVSGSICNVTVSQQVSVTV